MCVLVGVVVVGGRGVDVPILGGDLDAEADHCGVS